MALALGVLVALATALGLSAVLSWCGPVDRPRERGMHTAPTPTSGGLAIMGGLFVGVAALQLFGGAAPGRAVSWTLAIAAAHGLLGAVDDVFDLGARPKLAVQVLLALAFAGLVAHPHAFVLTDALALPLPDWLSIPGTALWLVVVVNAVNFMDGSNGLVAGAAAVVAAGLAALGLGQGLPAIGLVAASLAAACLGFLPLNFPKARLFQGDVGALFVGALLAMLPVVGATGGENGLPLWVGPIALMPILVDVLLTLIARARRREPLLQAHRSHLYQRWLASRGGDHAVLAWRFWLIMAAFTGAALFSARVGPGLAGATFLTSLMVAIAGWLWIDRRVRSA